MEAQKKRCWAEISLANIEHNYKQLRSVLPAGCKFLGVVKANAYGHGAVQVAEVLEKAGADYLAVAFIDEALELRRSGIRLPILVLGYTFPEYTQELIEYDITQAVSSAESGLKYAGEAEKLGKRLKCHLKIDSGMGRTGISAAGDLRWVSSMLDEAYLDFEGVFTHFAVSDICTDPFTDEQYRAFCDTVAALEELSGHKFEIIHCANSGAMINYVYTYRDMVRPGILLYGHYPDEEKGIPELRPAMTLKTRIVQIKDVDAGDSISYGRTWTADSRKKIAVLSIGYADGLSRALSNNAEFLLRGQRIKQIGRICMDMCMAEISDIPDAEVGDEVTVFGAELPIEEQAKMLGTISYELLCDVSVRVPRVYTY